MEWIETRVVYAERENDIGRRTVILEVFDARIGNHQQVHKQWDNCDQVISYFKYKYFTKFVRNDFKMMINSLFAQGEPSLHADYFSIIVILWNSAGKVDLRTSFQIVSNRLLFIVSIAKSIRCEVN